MGRSAKSDDFYRSVALMYLEYFERYGQRVIAEMTEALGKRREHANRSRNTVSTWVRRAREEGWLTRSTQGKAGGAPGPKLRAWLKEQEDNE